MLIRSPNGHLHLALAVALAASSIIALVAPISRTRANEEDGSGQVLGGGLAGVLQTQAASVSQVLATPAATRAGRQASWGISLSMRLTPAPLLGGALRLGLGGAFGGAERVPGAAEVAPVSFTLHEDGFTSSQTAAGPAVGDALAALGVAVSEHDLVSPAPSSPLVPGMHVYVQHAAKVEVAFGGEARTLFTKAATVRETLAEAGYVLEPADLVFPPLDSAVGNGSRITVTTLREAIEFRDQPIPFDTRYEYDASLPEGRSAVVQAGVEGHFRRQYRVRLVNGVEVLRELVLEVVIPPSDEVVAVGTYVAPAQEPEPTPPPVVAPGPGGELVCVRTMTVYATWYTAASAGGSGITATGATVDRGIVAVDPSVIPLGTHMYIPGYGYAVAADTGGGIIGNMIDLGFGDDDVPDWRTQWVDICILD